jgi:hypothetical protein
MGTEILRLISTAAGQILRTKGTVLKSRDSVERCQRLLKESIARCEKWKPRVKLAENSNTRFFPDCAGKKRFACWRTADKFNWQSRHRIRHAGMDCRHPGPQGRLRRHPCKPGFRHSMPERRYRGERQAPKPSRDLARCDKHVGFSFRMVVRNEISRRRAKPSPNLYKV